MWGATFTDLQVYQEIKAILPVENIVSMHTKINSIVWLSFKASSCAKDTGDLSPASVSISLTNGTSKVKNMNQVLTSESTGKAEIPSVKGLGGSISLSLFKAFWAASWRAA